MINAFKAPDRIEESAAVLAKLEAGSFKPRVRSLEVERAVDRLRAQNGVTLRAVVACTALNCGVVLSCTAAAPAAAATACFSAAGVATLAMLAAALKLSSLDKKEAQLSGA